MEQSRFDIGDRVRTPFSDEVLTIVDRRDHYHLGAHEVDYQTNDGDTKFELSLMDNRDPDKDEHGNTLYMITELPGCSQYRADYSPRERQMRIRLGEGATLEMPFTPDVLRDEFMRYVAGLLLCNTLVTVKNYHEYHLEED